MHDVAQMDHEFGPKPVADVHHEAVAVGHQGVRRVLGCPVVREADVGVGDDHEAEHAPDATRDSPPQPIVVEKGSVGISTHAPLSVV